MDDPSKGYESYDPAFFKHLFQIEDRHFWFRARNEIIAATLNLVRPQLPPDYRVLEIGCGTGKVLQLLETLCRDGSVCGMDLYAESLELARKRVTCPLMLGNFLEFKFNNDFHVIGIFDVLEHIEEEDKALQKIRDTLAPGGRLILTVPAYSSLWSYFDQAARHCRRYEPDDLRSRLETSGFIVDYLTPFMAFLFPVAWLSRRAAALVHSRRLFDPQARHALSKHDLRIVPIVNEVMTWILSREASAVKRKKVLPRGTSLLAVAHKC